VKINIHEQIYAWREVMEEKRQIPLVKKQAMRVAGQVLSHTVLYRTAASAMESTLKVLPRFALYNQLNAWGQHRENPQPAKRDLPRLVQEESERSRRKGDNAMNFRDTILQHVRANQPASRELPAVPKFHSGQTTDLKEQFVSSLKELSGEVVTDPPADFEEFLKKRFPDAQTISSAVPEYAGNKSPEDFVRWSDASGIDVTIVRSPLGVAETGSVILSEEEFRVNTIGFLAHDIVILLDPSDIVENINYAYGHPISGTKPIAC
jgi:L-lactate dehydrogenase complex protein LldG